MVENKYAPKSKLAFFTARFLKIIYERKNLIAKFQKNKLQTTKQVIPIYQNQNCMFQIINPKFLNIFCRTKKTPLL